MNNNAEEKKVVVSKKSTQKDYVSAIGRRKASSVQVRLYKKDVTVFGGIEVKKGEIIVNSKPAVEYFGKKLEKICKSPLKVTGAENKFAISIKASGGGKMGQITAIVLALARALDKVDRDKFHSILKKHEMLTRDARARERRKVGMGGKSRRKKQSPKR